VIRRDLSQEDAAGSESPFHLEPAGPQHLPLAASFNAKRCYRRATAVFGERLARGYSGLVALMGDEMVGQVWWVDAGHPPHPEVVRFDIPMDDGEVYSFDLFLAEEHRGGGNATVFLDQVHAAVQGLGYRAMWGYVESDNVASRWLFSICGYTVVKRRRSWRILSRLLVMDRKVYLDGGRGLRPLLAF
jgi:GNAT superfamily N-acetyltransferase